VVFAIAGPDGGEISSKFFMLLKSHLNVNDEPTVLIFNKTFFQPDICVSAEVNNCPAIANTCTLVAILPLTRTKTVEKYFQ
jgi:hypothetical protein